MDDMLERILSTQHELREKGRRTHCLNCNNLLLSTDEDHSFCNSCWRLMMEHKFEAEPEMIDGKYNEWAGLCIFCGESFDDGEHLQEEC